MPAFAATLKPLGVTAFSITAPEDMSTALIAAMGLGMHGTIKASFDRLGQAEWKVEVVDPQGHASMAGIGDVFIWDGLSLTAVSQNEFDARYDVTP